MAGFKIKKYAIPALACIVGLIALAAPGRGAEGSITPQVQTLRTPEGGIQPQTARTADGVLHLIYFRGEANAGDIEYVRRAPGAKDFSAPIRVNSQPESAVAVGTVRGPQMAAGPNGRVYVVWFGSAEAQPRGPDGTTPVLFSRLNDAGTGFEAQRCVMQYAKGVDGGLSVAAGPGSEVYVVWHANGSEPGEEHRRVYLARSSDDGRMFERETPISPADLGACGCCGMRAAVDAEGSLYVLFRAAVNGMDRDMTMLESTDRGKTFTATRVGAWHLNACPMSTASLNHGGKAMLAAWETAGEVFFKEANAPEGVFSKALNPSGKAGDRKHPAVAGDKLGWVLLAWTEGTGWKKGGSLAWQLYDPDGNPAGAIGHAPGVPVWGLATAFADGDGNFTIVY